jgi:hypothetical protein
MEYAMTIHSVDPKAFARLSDDLRKRDEIVEFRLSPSGG